METKQLNEEANCLARETGQYYSITTRRYTLRCSQEERLKITRDFYNEVLLFYYRLFLRTEEQDPGRLAALSNQQVLRELEIMTVAGREGKTVPCPLPWKRVPLYFRRAAVNGAIGEARSFLSRRRAGRASAGTERFHKGVTFYKGMYRDLTDSSVSLRLWDGKNWSWVHCRLKGRELPADAGCLSPTLNLAEGGAVLYVPIREKVEDGRRAKERMEAGTRICSLQFTNGDAFAVGVILEPDGSQAAVRFFRGGREYSHLCRMRLERIQKSGRAMGLPGYTAGILKNPPGQIPDREEDQNGQPCVESNPVHQPGTGKPVVSREKSAGVRDDGRETTPERYNRKYWTKLKHLNDYYAHRVSREIVDYCEEYQAGMIAVPRYDESYSRTVPGRAGKWSVLGLGRRICTLLSYKAWQAGIVVVEVHAGGTGGFCSICGEAVRKSGSEYLCPQGHRGSRYLNTARNLGRKCLKGFGREAGVPGR